jgi:hypothetical protein
VGTLGDRALGTSVVLAVDETGRPNLHDGTLHCSIYSDVLVDPDTVTADCIKYSSSKLYSTYQYSSQILHSSLAAYVCMSFEGSSCGNFGRKELFNTYSRTSKIVSPRQPDIR